MSDLGGQRVLYVEDNADLREVVAALLTAEGYSVVVAESALDGLACLYGETFDAVVSDYGLPDHTGMWMLREAEANGLMKATATLIVTAFPDPDVGDTPILKKPLDFDGFLGKLDDLIRAKSPMDEPLAPRSGVVAGQPSHREQGGRREGGRGRRALSS